MRLIGLCGYAGSGKDTACEAILDSASLKKEAVDRVAFADKMKLFAAECLGLTSKFNGDLIERMNQTKDEEIVLFKGRRETHALTGRQFLQHMGPAARNTIDQDFWINLVLPIPFYGDDPFGTPDPLEKDLRKKENDHNLQEMFPEREVLIITDVRYQNEALRIHELGGENWLIERPGYESDGHESEILPPDSLINRLILNDSDIDTFWDRVVKAYNE